MLNKLTIFEYFIFNIQIIFITLNNKYNIKVHCEIKRKK